MFVVEVCCLDNSLSDRPSFFSAIIPSKTHQGLTLLTSIRLSDHTYEVKKENLPVGSLSYSFYGVAKDLHVEYLIDRA